MESNADALSSCGSLFVSAMIHEVDNAASVDMRKSCHIWNS